MNFLEWNERPIEVRTLFNPAFCGVILYSAIQSYQKEIGSGMPIPLVFLVLPLVLHSKTRTCLPRAKTSNLGLWCKENESQLIMLAERAQSLNRIVIQTIALLCLDEHFKIENSLITVGKKIGGIPAYLNTSDEIKEIYNKSAFLGKWFANAGEVSNVYTYLGVRP